MMRKAQSESGIAMVLALIVLIFVCLTLMATAAGSKALYNTAATTGNSSVALAKAEDGLAVVFAKLKTGNKYADGANFTITTTDGWTVTETHSIISGLSYWKSKATSGRYERTVQVRSQVITVPFNEYACMSDGTMTIESGSYDLNSNSLYATQNINVSNCSVSGPGRLASNANVRRQSGHIDNQVTVDSNAPRQTINAPNWEALADAATIVHNNVSTNLDISDEVRNANGGFIVIRVSSGSPVITVGGGDFSNSKATIVIIKDNSTATPVLQTGNGSYNNTEISAFVDGAIDFSSGSFKTSGVLYATGDINLSSAAVDITGGVVSQSNIYLSSVSFDIYNPYWDKYYQYFDNNNPIVKFLSWKEL